MIRASTAPMPALIFDTARLKLVADMEESRGLQQHECFRGRHASRHCEARDHKATT